MLLTMQETVMKNIDGVSKTQDSINNLKEHRKYQNGFVIFDVESNFEYIYPVFTLLSFFNFFKKYTILIEWFVVKTAIVHA